jgi:hypothetical protein
MGLSLGALISGCTAYAQLPRTGHSCAVVRRRESRDNAKVAIVSRYSNDLKKAML